MSTWLHLLKFEPAPIYRSCLALGSLAFVLILAGCAGIKPGFETPRVSLVALEPLDVQLFEQRYGLRLRIQNPNDTELRIKGLDYEVELNGETFGTGVSNAAATVPAYGEATLDLTMVSNLARVLNQFDQLLRDDAPSLDYAIRGKLSLDGLLLALPFSREGSLTLPGRESNALKAADVRWRSIRVDVI